MGFKPNFRRESPGETAHRPKLRRKRLKTVAMLPALLTLGNLFFGFLAIYCCGLELHDVGAGIDAYEAKTLNSNRIEAIAPTFLAVGVMMLIGAMICDALDGRVARLTGQASRFGEQLDSLADAVSFGVAPAFLMIAMMRREVAQWGYVPFGYERFGQAVVLIGAVYALCTSLRLARFNVETSLEEAAHHGFRGLPSPGAAAAVISLIWLHEHLDLGGVWGRMAAGITYVMPICTLMVALLMVSRIPYMHALGVVLRRRPFGHVVLILLGLLLFLLHPVQMGVVLAWFFVLSGPVGKLWRRIAARPTKLVPASPSTDADAASILSTERKAQ
ncbi:MAG TPA: CDP-alcohol phosphatidyltransferase family protein [Phycisphaerae bacterium]|nr:CDP-alcohol phosphatidyltransferase family protein [Phycisphaerae bacterium]